MFANATVAEKWKSYLKAQKTIMQHKPSVPSVGAEVCKVYDVPNAKPETLILETYAGTERHRAFARFEELKKLYPNIETVKDIDKKFWEK